MYKRHQQLPMVSDNNITVWKYMDIFKYLTILENSEFYFLNVINYKDKFDGFMPRFDESSTIDGHLLNPTMCQALNQSYDQIRSYSYANCWTISEYESPFFWDCYSDKNGGVAIQSTVQLLCDSIVDQRDIHISPVVYDFPNIDIGNVYWPLFKKRPEFLDEKEIRLIYVDKAGLQPNAEHNINGSVNIKVDINKLIVNTFFHPSTPTWMVEVLSSVISKYSIKPPIKSNLYYTPFNDC